MKKYIIKNISILLTFVLLMTTFFSVSAYAISTSCVEDHFSKLVFSGSTIRTPPSVDSCAYAAISMLLSFYDSYWRDDFIVSVDGINETDWRQGRYDPITDTLTETFSASREARAWNDFANSDQSNYGEFITHPDNDHYLESYLISLAKEINLCEEDATVFGLKGYEIVELLEYYLYDVRGFTEDQITVHIESEINLNGGNEALFEQMVNHINDGFPLIYGGYDCDIDFSQIDLMDQINDQIQSQVGGHAMIAYSFEGTLQNPIDVNLHTGWSGLEHTESVNETEYRFFNSIIWLEIVEENLPHQCTDAYRDLSDTTKTYCACEIYTKHSAHENNHLSISGNTGRNETHHWTNACHCGKPGPDSVTSLHNLSYTYIESPNKHHEECSGCGYSDDVEHTYNQYAIVSNTHHTRACACGATNGDEEAHVESFCVSQGSDIHYVYCKCGHIISQDYHEMVPMNIRYSKCRRCGYIRDNNNPGFIIKGVEDEYDTCKE